MNAMSRKIALGMIAAVALAAMAPGEAQAQWRGGGWRGGGWHGGGWHGGGYSGGWHGGGWRGHRGHGANWVGPAVAGVIGGLALGALASSAYPAYGYGYGQPYYGYGPTYYGGCTWRRQPTYDPWGRFIGYGSVQVCY